MNKAFVREPDTTEVLCPRCGAAGIDTLRAAFETHVPADARRPLAASTYFCPTPTCPVAYFDAFEAVVTIDALTTSVYPKDPAAPLCPCFGLTLEDADNINQAYRHFRAANVGIEDVLRQQRNAVMLWQSHPSDTDIARITGCLKS